jgi:hypothetical protein
MVRCEFFGVLCRLHVILPLGSRRTGEASSQG